MFKNFHTTTAIQFVLHSALSILIGGIVSLLTVFGQNAFTGNTDLKTALLSGFAGLGVYFTTHLAALQSSPQTAQAEADVIGEVKDTVSGLAAQVEGLVTSHNSLLDFLMQPPSAPVQQGTFTNVKASTISPWADPAIAGVKMPVQQVAFPPLPSFTAPQAAISSSQAQQGKP